MDKAIIFGIYDFVSFHTCKALLNKGIEVIGVHIDEAEKSSFIDEKRLEIGRNSNFREESFSTWGKSRQKEDTTEKATLFISIYDLYMLGKEDLLSHEPVTSTIRKYMKDYYDSFEVVIILPVQMLKSNNDKTIGAFLERANVWSKHKQFIYLPAVYGPWQPSTFLFQQAIQSKFNHCGIMKNAREWTGDVLFVDDAVETIVDTLESRNDDDSNSYMLESGETDYWKKCADALQIEMTQMKLDQTEALHVNKQIAKILVKRVTPFVESITKQLEQVQRISNQP